MSLENRIRLGSTLTDHVRKSVTSLLRGYIRHMPISAGKRALWTKIIDPYLAWQPHEFEARTVFGSKIAGDSQDILHQYVYYFGIWEPNLTHWITERLKPGDTFVDVGANVGYFSLLASKIVGNGGSVVAIEASPTIFRALERNMELNRVDNVRAVNIAVAAERDRVKVFRGDESHIGLASIVEPSDSGVECEIGAAALDDILTPEEVKGARLVKIDVEGAEALAVAGMESVLASGRSNLEVMVEIDPVRLSHQGRTAEDVCEPFFQAGFVAYWLENDYSPMSYLPPRDVKRPQRLQEEIHNETDVIFSRLDADIL